MSIDGGVAKAIQSTLDLTSPFTRGRDVKLAQARLNSNRFGDFMAGRLDGEYGKVTAAGAYRAKFLLGFPTKLVNTSYGPTLDAILRGDAKLPKSWAARRAIRRRQWAKRMRTADTIGARAVVEARRHLGYHESPIGYSKFGAWYGIPYGAWCAMFTTWCAVQAGSRAAVRGSRWAYVPYVVSDGVNHRNGLVAVGTPKLGDLVCFDWDGGVADHIGRFVRWIDSQRFEAIEGNTANAVALRIRYRSQVEAWVRETR